MHNVARRFRKQFSIIFAWSVFLFFCFVIPAKSDELKDLQYKHSCYTGVGSAQKFLPSVPQKDDLMARGFLSCDGSLKRLKKSGELDQEKNVIEFSCGYSIGAMFAKYDLSDEVKPPLSERAKNAMHDCIEKGNAQKISNPPASSEELTKKLK